MMLLGYYQETSSAPDLGLARLSHWRLSVRTDTSLRVRLWGPHLRSLVRLIWHYDGIMTIITSL